MIETQGAKIRTNFGKSNRPSVGGRGRGGGGLSKFILASRESSPMSLAIVRAINRPSRIGCARKINSFLSAFWAVFRLACKSS